MKKMLVSIIFIGLVGIVLTGCGSNTSKSLSNGNKAVKTTANVNPSTSPPKQNSLFNTSLKLPNGDVVKPDKTVKWKDLSIQLIVTNLPSQISSPDKYKEIIGNHSTIISHEKVSFSGGKADLVLNKRTSPAVSKTTNETHEYWVIEYGSQYAYAIDATIIGNKDKAKSEVMELLKNWKVPK